MKDVKRAFLMVWLIVALGAGALAAAPWVAGEEAVYGWVPRCSGCSLCGMTTAFVHISRGEFDEARRANRGSLPVYAGFSANALAALIFIAWKGIPWKY
jgi:hypothetical protein